MSGTMVPPLLLIVQELAAVGEVGATSVSDIHASHRTAARSEPLGTEASVFKPSPRAQRSPARRWGVLR